MITLDAATVLLQWAVGGLFFLWVTTRRREVGIGYGWLMRAVFGLMAAGGLAVGLVFDPVPVREVAAAGVVLATGGALVASVVRRRAGVAGHRGVDPDGAEFPPVLDLVDVAEGRRLQRVLGDPATVEQGRRTVVAAARVDAP